MSDSFSIALTGLRVARTALDVASSNVSNATTEGRSRQTVSLSQNASSWTGGAYIGGGVSVTGVTSSVSSYLEKSLTYNSSSLSMLETKSSLSEELSQTWATLTSSMQSASSLFSDASSETVAGRNSAYTSLNTVFSTLSDTQQSLSTRISELTNETSGFVDQANSLAANVASLNVSIRDMENSGQDALSLRDQRNVAVRDLLKMTGGTFFENNEGVSVISGGVSLVSGSNSISLSASRSTNSIEIKASLSNGTSMTVGALGGKIGGYVEMSRDFAATLGEASRFSAVLGSKINEWQSIGVDKSGNMGTPLVNLPSPTSVPSASNTGTGSISTTYGASADFSGDSSFTMTFNGSSWDIKGNSGTSYQGSLPSTLSGVTISLSGSANAGDSFEVYPFGANGSQTKLIGSADSMALSSPAYLDKPSDSNASLNVSGVVSNLPVSVTISSDGASYTMTDGSGVSVTNSLIGSVSGQGWTLDFPSAPSANASFTINASPAGSQDVSRASGMSDIFKNGLSDIANKIAKAGASAASYSSQSETASASVQAITASRESLSGVNLDEEAAEIMRWSQMYEAASKALSITQGLFDTFLQSIG